MTFGKLLNIVFTFLEGIFRGVGMTSVAAGSQAAPPTNQAAPVTATLPTAPAKSDTPAETDALAEPSKKSGLSFLVKLAGAFFVIVVLVASVFVWNARRAPASDEATPLMGIEDSIPNPTPTLDPVSPETEEPTESMTPMICENRGAFLADISVPDNTAFSTPGEIFIKTWRLKNTGTCTWTTGYTIVFQEGDILGGQSVNLSHDVAPGETIEVSVELTVPDASDTYQGWWCLADEAGMRFSSGGKGAYFWVKIVVALP
ncbi:MAG: hypothetical protein A2418_03105 [Candidatus Brennerbacteria bacterium RIFOXYC1_FULL_41_11]|uniref:Nbr1 FW domain-containing protein n=1 Tax=Candidatus Brennerbacteria bacterium RIFOXYD1_FULL_41_16 TaxID=1797529 RepID=A0A1G1XLU7_9BACT|nr:MAG: hypothetical protein UU61_C0009G0003 [Parcubacteria group bacterium GW2011_GWB1_41_4]OGY39821.1 MAG: hypothetical protein A2418_03105 [Candidatus Brennerbacteria bacterium RIFOXYC1_FULL_41_11]OGY40580.1 MAG: hypothetical protein A2570_02495 [Candidatus Brennerbacteria bacterium RIFOXYD1_FULL_41_16]